MKTKVLMIILDGFSSNYLKKELCPNLYHVAREHFFSKIEPMFGFQGVGAAIYSGASPDITGVFTEFVLKKNDIINRSRFLKVLLRFTDVVPNDRLLADIRYLLFRILGMSRPGISNVIPSELLGFFSPKLTKEFTEEKSLGNVTTIFDILRANNMSYNLQRPATRLESATISKAIYHIKKRKMPDLVVIHPCSLDIIGHDFGLNTVQMEHALKTIDSHMYRIIRSVRSSSEEIVTLFISDHGMCPVRHNINLFKILRQLPLELGKDYLVFLDSTMARFWFFNEKASKLIYETISDLKFGYILHESDLKKLRIEKIDREHGDLFFVLREGYVFFPDFFRKYNPPKGMHGYAFSNYDNPIMILYSPKLVLNPKREKIRLIDIFPTILELLNLPIPHTCEGRSILS